MTYQEQYEQAQRKGSTVVMTVDMKKWEEENDILIGKLEKIEEFTESEFDNSCMKYTFDTDDGKTSTVLGAVSDKVLNNLENVGGIFMIKFLGKVETKKGNRCNNFQIIKINGDKK